MVSAPALATLPVPAEVLRLQALARRETTPCGDGDMVWQCSNCGHIVIGKNAPEVCPVCNHPQAYFEISAENF